VHVPISDAPRRPRGHRFAGSRTDGQLARRSPRSARLALTRATETALMPHLAGRHQHSQDAFRRIATNRVSPTVDALGAVWFESASSFTHRSHPGAAALVCQHGLRRAPRPASLRRLALRLLARGDARCVGPTSAISRSRTSTRASSALVASDACAPAKRGDRLLHVQGDSLRWVARSPRRRRRGGRCLPAVTCANRTSDTPVASLTWSRRSREPEPPWGPPRSPASHPRERGALPQ
jgi:hypothetical protein